MRFSKAFAQQSRIWIFSETVACVAIIGLLDYVSGVEIRLLPFYAGPIFIAAWFAGRRAGLAVAAISGAIWWTANWLTGDPELHSSMRAWETFRHIGFFLVVAWAASALRTKNDIAAARIALLERSHRLEREIISISEAEQRRIGQDLHDGLCQYLAALSCSATSLRDDLQELHLSAEANTAGELANQLRDAVLQTRDLARGLAPAHVSQVGLVLALESLAQSVSRLQGIRCSFRTVGPTAECDEGTAVHLYRIAQEAINNATRHGRATQVSIQLETSDDLLGLQIRDNGVGFSTRDPSGLGLTIMRYRARSNGGELKIEQPEEGGTVISCTARPRLSKDETVAV
jgi:signal transduction histidine kinase